MKKPIILLLAAFSIICFGTNYQFYLSSKIHNNSQFEFIPHNSKGRFGTYLAMNINYKPMKNLFYQLTNSNNISNKLKTRGEAHITVVTPVEYYSVLKNKISIENINKIALNYNIQSSNFEVVCLGRGAIQRNNRMEETFYVVVNSEDLLNIRRKIQMLYLEKGGNADKFNPEHYYPHITLGFSSRDLHESDGITKNSKSCYANLKN